MPQEITRLHNQDPNQPLDSGDHVTGTTMYAPHLIGRHRHHVACSGVRRPAASRRRLAIVELLAEARQVSKRMWISGLTRLQQIFEDRGTSSILGHFIGLFWDNQSERKPLDIAIPGSWRPGVAQRHGFQKLICFSQRNHLLNTGVSLHFLYNSPPQLACV